ncbi:hypothetical protein [Halobellus sp. EA9]|uniref:hypothetical protein n=1 Tax=Halobellus sp. EA9 TaxID=3421647 RepID=UPI003EBA33F4
MRQNWAKLLHFIYTHDQKREYYKLTEPELQGDHPLVQNTDLSAEEARDAFRFLQRNDLIEDHGEEFFQLTKKGFEVARDHEQAASQAKINQSISTLTAVLAFVAIIDLALSLDGLSRFSSVLLAIVVIILIGLVVSSLADLNVDL